MRRLRVALLVTAAVLALAAVGGWLLRDWPRRQVERSLEAELSAEVDLGRLEILGTRTFVLHDLEIRRIAGQPLVHEVRVRALRVLGSIPAVRAGRFDAVDAEGLEVVLGPPLPGTPPAPPPVEEEPTRVGRLRVRDGTIAVGPARAVVQADVRGIGTDAAGSASLASGALPLAPLLETAGLASATGWALQRVAATLELDGGSAGGRASVNAGALLDGERDLGPVGLDVQAAPAPGTSVLHAVLVPRAPFLREGRAEGTLDVATLAPGTARVRLAGLDLATLLALVPLLPEGWEVAGTADIEAERFPDGRAEVRAEGALERVVAAVGDGAWRAGDVAVRVAATVPSVEAPDRAEVALSGTVPRLAGPPLPPSAFPATVEARGTVRLAHGAFAGADLAGIDVGTRLGSLSASGAVGPDLAADLRWTVEGARLEALGSLLPAVPLPEARGALTARGTLRGPLAGPALEGEALLSGTRLAHAAGTLEGARGSMSFRWSPGSPVDLPRVRLEGDLAVPPLAAVPVTASASGAVDLAGPSARIPSLELASPGLGTVRGSGRWSAAGDPRAEGALELAGADLARWRPLLAPLLGGALAGYEVKGLVRASLRGALAPAGTWTASGRAAVETSGFASADGSQVLEGFDSTWTLSGEGDLSGTVRAGASGEIGGFQVLWGTIFADGSGLSSAAEVAARRDPDGSLRGTLAWTIPDGPALEARGRLAPDGALSGEGRVRAADLRRSVGLFRDALAGSVPFLEKVESEGALSLDVRGARGPDGALALAGHLTLSEAGLSGVQGVVALSGLDLDLPFDLRWGPPDGEGRRVPAGPPVRGSMGFDRLQVAGLDLQATATPVEVSGDTVAFVGRLTLPVAGGRIDFDRLRLAGLLGDGRHVETAVVLDGIDVGRVADAFGLPPLEGRADGAFPSVLLSPEVLEVTGGGEIHVFGGTVQVGAISGREILTRFPRITFSIRFDDLDLGQVTRTFDFGEITGIVEGYVNDCRLFRGVPVSFEALARTVERKGVPRTVNVKAIQNIAILGGGGRIGLLDRGIHRLFDKYTYAEIGISTTLADDVFTVRGLAGDGPRELFVKGRLPFPIDVVNALPGQTVAFSSMLERLRSIDFSAASTAAPAGPPPSANPR